MKYVFYIISILFLSCESQGLGVNENQGMLSYYDYVAFGWQTFFDNDVEDNDDNNIPDGKELALLYFNTAYDAEDEDYHNSAHIAIGWVNLFIANDLVTIDETLVEEYRDMAYDEFLFDANESLAIDSYSEHCHQEFCCDDCFAKERILGLTIYSIEKYFQNNSQNINQINGLISDLKQFIQNNSDYSFMNGKPKGTDGEIITLDINNVIVYLSQVYAKLGRYLEACELLENHNLECPDIDIDCSNINVYYLLECIETYSSF